MKYLTFIPDGSGNNRRPCRHHEPCTRTRERAIRRALRHRNASRLPRLEMDLLCPRSRQPQQLRCCAGQRCSVQGLPEGHAPLPGRHHHRRLALQVRAIGRKQQSLWPGPILRSRRPHEHSVYDQGFEKVCRNRRLGIRSLRQRQTWRRSLHEKLLPLPPEGPIDRPRLHPLRPVTLNATTKRNGTHAAAVARQLDNCNRPTRISHLESQIVSYMETRESLLPPNEITSPNAPVGYPLEDRNSPSSIVPASTPNRGPV